MKTNPVIAQTDPIRFLEEAKEDVLRLEEQNSKLSTLQDEEKKLQRKLEDEKSAVQNEIQTMLRKRKQSLTSSYDKELQKAQDELKTLNSKKEEARNQGVRARIQAETKDLREEEKNLRVKSATLFKQNGLPSYLNTYMSYSLLCPRTWGQGLTAVGMVLVLFGILPYLVFRFLKPGTPLLQTLVGFLAVLIFGGLYFLLLNRYKLKAGSILMEGSNLRIQTAAVRKKIRIVENIIRKDKDDTHYNLESHNYEIASKEAELESLAKKKQEALKNFDLVTTRVIKDEIEESNRERLTAMQEELFTKGRELQETKSVLSETQGRISENYEGYLGKEFLDTAKIDALLEILRSGQVQTLTEAMTEYRTRKG